METGVDVDLRIYIEGWYSVGEEEVFFFLKGI